MKKIVITTLGLPAVLALLVAGCTPDDPSSSTVVAPSTTQVLAKYVAIGNSLTAGFMDAGLIIDGQLASVPRLIAGQLGLDVSTASEAFTQPYVAPPGVGSSRVPDGFVAGVLYWDTTAGAITMLGTTPETEVENLLLARTLPVPYHNLGVPGGWLQDVFTTITGDNAYAGENPYFDLILRNSPAQAPFMADRSQLQQGVAKGPTLVTLWIGCNNILGPALGGEINETTGAPMTSVQDFTNGLTTLVSTLIGQLRQVTGFAPYVVMGNLQDDLPYCLPRLVFEQVIGGGWPWGYVEDDVTRVLFPTLSWVQDAGNQGNPIPETLTLTGGEFGKVQEFIDAYNQAIDNVAGLHPTVAVADVRDVMNGLSAEQRTHFLFLVSPPASLPVEVAAQTTVFSLDGIHPNNRGYGIIANAFIAKVNELLGTNVAPVDWQALTWDPTYAAYQKSLAAVPAGTEFLTPAAARAMGAVFTR